MLRFTLLLALLAAVAVGCDSGEKKPFTTSQASPKVDNLPPGVKLPDQPKGDAKPDKTKSN